jgi:serine/threonine protein kinase/tetratricopeptide (TPR) repeat protein
MSSGPRDPVSPGDGETTREAASARETTGAVGPYRLLQPIGEGGMGEVWLAEQARPVRRQVAVKIIKAGMDSAQVVARFEAERQALALMDHSAIAKVFDAGATPQGRPYFAMEYVKGEPITVYCDRHRLNTPERLGLFIHVCEGVQHAHQKGIIHRDLKPSNVLVTIQDDRPVPKIIDFGVAKATAQHLTERTLFTELGVLIGTPEYMSPEQAEMGGLDIDTRTDVYALGVMLYELLAGALPFDRNELRRAGLLEIQRIIREKEPPRPSTRVTQRGPASTEAAHHRHTEPARLASELRGDLDWITMKALEKDRTRRYGSASELAADVRRHVEHQPVLASPPSTLYQARKFVRRHRFGVGAATALAVLLAAFGVTMAVQAQRVSRERDRANREAARANREAQAAVQVADFLAGLFRVSDPAEARGRAVTAREVLDKGAARIVTELTHDLPLQARLLFTMGDVYRNLGALDRAGQLLKQSLDTRSLVLGAEAPDTLRTMSLLGSVYDNEGKTEEAEKLLTSALAAERRTLGETHPNTLKTLANLANLYDSQGHYEKSVPMMQEVYERRRTTLGGEHLDTLGSQCNLAIAKFRGQRFADAEQLLRDAIATLTRVAGGDHPRTLMAQDLLATVYLDMKRPQDARRILDGVYETRRRVLGPDHMDTLGTALGLANAARQQGRVLEAERLFRDTLAAQERVEGPDHPDALATRTGLATMLSAAGRLDEAERLWRDTLHRMQRTLGVGHPSTANCFVGLAAVEMHRGRRDAALDLLTQAVRVDPRWGANLRTQPGFDALKGNPEFDRLVVSGDRK